MLKCKVYFFADQLKYHKAVEVFIIVMLFCCWIFFIQWWEINTSNNSWLTSNHFSEMTLTANIFLESPEKPLNKIICLLWKSYKKVHTLNNKSRFWWWYTRLQKYSFSSAFNAFYVILHLIVIVIDTTVRLSWLCLNFWPPCTFVTCLNLDDSALSYFFGPPCSRSSDFHMSAGHYSYANAVACKHS